MSRIRNILENLQRPSLSLTDAFGCISIAGNATCLNLILKIQVSSKSQLEISCFRWQLLSAICIKCLFLFVQISGFCEFNFDFTLFPTFSQFIFLFRTHVKQLRTSSTCYCAERSATWKMSKKRRNVYLSDVLLAVLVDVLRWDFLSLIVITYQLILPVYLFQDNTRSMCYKTLSWA